MAYGQITSTSQPGVIRGDFTENENLEFRAYITNADGTVPTSKTGNVGVNVYRSGSATAVYTSSNVSSAAVAALSTSGWTRGGDGFNFYAPLAASLFEHNGGYTYRFEFSVPLTAGTAYVIFEGYCNPLGTA